MHTTTQKDTPTELLYERTPHCQRCRYPIWLTDDRTWQPLVVDLDNRGVPACQSAECPDLPPLRAHPPSGDGQTAVCPHCRYLTRWTEQYELWAHEPASFIATTIYNCDYQTPPRHTWITNRANAH